MDNTRSWTHVVLVSITSFAIQLLRFNKPAERKTFNIDDSTETKLLAALRPYNTLWPCIIEAETTTHFFVAIFIIQTDQIL